MKDKLTKKERIKYIIFLIIWFLLIGLVTTHAQNNISIGLYQDIKLATVGDDKGNNPFTLDAKLDIGLHGFQLKNYYFSIHTQFEYADLKGGDFGSVMVIPNWTMNNLVLDDLEISGGVLIGLIHRWGQAYATYGLNSDISYMIAPNIKLSLLGQLIKRSDLLDRWGTKGLSPSVYFGIKTII